MNEYEKKLADIRSEYLKDRLDENSVESDPIAQFRKWMDEAIRSEILHPTAMMLATANYNGKPSSRVVLLKSVNENGFTFFTDYSSRKGYEIEKNPHVALTFFWNGLERQIRIEGLAEKLPKAESDRYFHSRPYESRLSAAASMQSTEVPDREFLENKREELKNKLQGDHVLPPDRWGGYQVVPHRIEFWQGRENRLHDRILFVLEDEKWIIKRLAP